MLKQRKKIEPCYFHPDIDNPDWETDEAKWWLCDRGEKYNIWRADSKIDERNKLFFIIRSKDNVVVAEDHTIAGIGEKFSIYEKFY